MLSICPSLLYWVRGPGAEVITVFLAGCRSLARGSAFQELAEGCVLMRTLSVGGFEMRASGWGVWDKASSQVKALLLSLQLLLVYSGSDGRGPCFGRMHGDKILGLHGNLRLWALGFGLLALGWGQDAVSSGLGPFKLRKRSDFFQFLSLRFQDCTVKCLIRNIHQDCMSL